MVNSIIINKVLSLISFLKNSFQYSIFFKLFNKFDNFLKNTALNSIFLSLFLKPYRQFARDSKILGLGIKFLSTIKKLYPITKRWILGSNIVITFKEIISICEKNPLKIVGLFGTAFLVSNISFELIVKSTDILPLLIKLVLLFLFMFISKINISFKKLLNNSIFYKLFKWIISYNN